MVFFRSVFFFDNFNTINHLIHLRKFRSLFCIRSINWKNFLDFMHFRNVDGRRFDCYLRGIFLAAVCSRFFTDFLIVFLTVFLLIFLRDVDAGKNLHLAFWFTLNNTDLSLIRFFFHFCRNLWRIYVRLVLVITIVMITFFHSKRFFTIGFTPTIRWCICFDIDFLCVIFDALI